MPSILSVILGCIFSVYATDTLLRWLISICAWLICLVHLARLTLPCGPIDRNMYLDDILTLRLNLKLDKAFGAPATGAAARNDQWTLLLNWCAPLE